MSIESSRFSEKDISQKFSDFCASLFSDLKSGEHARVTLAAEQTQFLRMNRGAIRQSGHVQDAQLRVHYMTDTGRSVEWIVPFVFNDKTELYTFASEMIARVREKALGTPPDPYLNLPLQKSSSTESHTGNLLEPEQVGEAILGQLFPSDDLVGIYAGGPMISAMADSAGARHWFASESFFVDYSLWLESGRAVKASYAGRSWNQNDFEDSLRAARDNLNFLKNPQRTLRPGSYRAYLAPSATSELLNMLSWGAVSEGAIQRKESPLCALRTGEKNFSTKFSLIENFALGFTPRFSDDGELAPESIALFDDGRFVQALVSARTQKEFGVASNGAGSERLRTPDMGTGQLDQADIFRAIGTGLYLSDLHYLNWSDIIQGRVTGMTRYGCLWVENGEPVGPIQDMRFDESLFHCFGSELSEITREAHVIPETSTYGRRAFGGARVPGILLNNFQFTL